MSKLVKGIGALITSVGAISGIIISSKKSIPPPIKSTAKSIVPITQEESNLDTGGQPQPITEANSPSTPLSEEEQRLVENRNREIKANAKSQADKVFKKLNDYTFRLFGPCSIGTGGVLDYQLPKAGEKYPTTGYIATNAHVISDFRFSENPYNQLLPFDEKSTKQLREKRQVNNSHLSLGDDQRTTCQSSEGYGYLDIGLSQQAGGAKEKADYGLVDAGKMKEPRLFGVAINYLEKNKESGVDYDHFSDFAVLELEFTSEEAARKATNNFADTYTLNSDNAINLFNKPLEELYTKKQLEMYDEYFFHLAYPYKENDKGNYTTNFDEKTLLAGQLANRPGDGGDPEVKYKRGFVEAKGVLKGFNGAGKKYREVGHFLKIKNNPLGGGSSGGLFTDFQGNVVGIITAQDNVDHSGINPLRSIGYESHTFKTPKYDLILGVEGQISSYRQQINLHNKTTGLSAKGGK